MRDNEFSVKEMTQKKHANSFTPENKHSYFCYFFIQVTW